jgi:hypothetical protein
MNILSQFFAMINAILDAIVDVILMIIKVFLPKPKIVRDETLGHSNILIYLNKLLKQKQWKLLEQKLAQANKYELSFFIEHLSSTSSTNAILLEAWYDERPKQIYPCLVGARYFVTWAWDARGTGYAETVSERMGRLFFERLNQAHILLEEAIEIDPTHSQAYYQMITLGKAYPYVDKKEVIAKMNEVDKSHFYAQTNIAYALTERWGGKKGEALKYAFNLCNDEPQGSTMHGLIAWVHIEEWVGLSNSMLRNKYFLSKRVKHEVFTAFTQAFPNEDFRDDLDAIDALNAYAFCFYLSKQKDLARKILLYLNGRANESPWDYLDVSVLWLFDSNYNYSVVHRGVGIASLD